MEQNGGSINEQRNSLVEVLKGRDIDAEEVRCAAKGEECCEFVMT